MNGLLHRLAARAIGTAVTLRSDARLPFGGGALTWADTLEPEFAATRNGMQPDEQISLSSAAQSGRVEPGLPLPGTTAQTATDAPSDEARPGIAPPVMHNPTNELRPDIALLPEQPLRMQTKLPSLRDREPSISHLPEEQLSARTEVPSMLDAPALAEMPGERVARRRQRPSIVPSEGDADIALRPAQSLGDPAPSKLVAADGSMSGPAVAPGVRSAMGAWLERAPWPQATARTVDEPTEVHIHIGRIDVTAVHEAPPPRPRPDPVPAPLSLDTYLARRSRS
jgi:hypothetical protein